MTTGYASDTPDIMGFYGELSPIYLNYICTLNGHRPRPLSEGFTYCDLGCGHGITVSILADLFPQGDFTGISLGQDQLSDGHSLAADAGLTNTQFMAMDFGELASAELPSFDFIVLHGVYALLGPGQRNQVRAFIKGRLKEGGIVYVSYESLPGSAALAPLRDLVANHTAPMQGDLPAKANAGRDFLHLLKSNKAAYFEDNPPAQAFVEQIENYETSRLAHAFFGPAIDPQYVFQVAADMDSAGLIYSGSAIAHLNFVDLAAPAEFHGLLKKAPSRIEFESQGDFIRNQRYRKDVFINDQAGMTEDDQTTLTEEEQTALLMDMPFGTICEADSVNRSVQFGDVKLKYIADLFEILIAQLSTGAKPVRELAGLDDLKSYSSELIIDGIRFLSAGGQIMPFASPTAAPTGAVSGGARFQLAGNLNLNLLKRRLLAQPTLGFAGKAAGIGLDVSMADALFILCSAETAQDQVAEWAFQRLLESGQQMVFEGGSEIDAIQQAVQTFQDTRLPKFLELGILEPAEENGG